MNKMAKSTYLSIITLSVNGLKAPIKTEWLTGYKNKTHAYGACKRITSDLKPQTD